MPVFPKALTRKRKRKKEKDNWKDFALRANSKRQAIAKLFAVHANAMNNPLTKLICKQTEQGHMTSERLFLPGTNAN